PLPKNKALLRPGVDNRPRALIIADPNAAPRKRIFAALFMLLGFIFCGLFGIGFAVALHEPYREAAIEFFQESMRDLGFTVSEIEVEGGTHVATDLVIAAAGFDLDSEILPIDLSRAKRAIENLPWVKRASVSRRLPDRLMVHIEEYEPAALWQLEQRLWLIDESGTPIVEVAPVDYPELFLLIGKGAGKRLANAELLVAEVAKAGWSVKAARLVGERRWDLILANDTVISLPETGPKMAINQLSALDAEYGLVAAAPARLDMRLGDYLVVRARDGKRIQQLRGPQTAL
ncbi:MAG: FtsQ-type POTRA domain-containing protein, partial [Pseudomonadota bacterium]